MLVGFIWFISRSFALSLNLIDMIPFTSLIGDSDLDLFGVPNFGVEKEEGGLNILEGVLIPVVSD